MKNLKKRNEIIRDFFVLMNQCAEGVPDENRCIMLLDAVDRVADKLKDPIVTANFELQWLDFYQKIKEYCLPSDLEFFKRKIEVKINLVLDQQRELI